MDKGDGVNTHKELGHKKKEQKNAICSTIDGSREYLKKAK